MIDQLGGRKTVLTVIVILLAIGAVFVKGDVPPGLSDFLKTVLATFVTGNVVSSVVGVMQTKAEAKPEEINKDVSLIPDLVTPMSKDELAAYLQQLYQQSEANHTAQMEAAQGTNAGLLKIIDVLSSRK